MKTAKKRRQDDSWFTTYHGLGSNKSRTRLFKFKYERQLGGSYKQLLVSKTLTPTRVKMGDCYELPRIKGSI